ncbi:MAG: arsenite methyltransferase [Anaerolineae bacterium]
MKEEIKARYADLALREMPLSCCSGVYTPTDLAGLPPEAAGLSLGCGNPVALASLRPGEVVLDIGSGAGLDVFLAARQVGLTGKAIGLDMTGAMIQRASQAAEQAGFRNIEFRLGDAEEMPLPDESVDVIISNCVINLTLDKGRVFREAYRVLRPGGRLMISDIVTDKPLPESVRSDSEEWARCVGGAIPDEEYTRLIAQAGFETVLCIHGLNFHQVGDVRVYSVNVSAKKPSRRLSVL